MKLKLIRVERDLIYFHLFFIILCVTILIIPISNSIGVKLFILVAIYNLILPILTKIRKYNDLLRLWVLVFIISLFQIWPDWFLSAQLNILIFPEDGLFKIGSVSGYMIGLWAIPLFVIIFTGMRAKDRYSNKIGYLIVVLLSLLIFGMAEQSMWMLESWYPQNVTLIFDHIAIYIIIPEVILGLSSYFVYNKIKNEKFWIFLLMAFLIMLLYLGSASFFYFLIEKVVLI